MEFVNKFNNNFKKTKKTKKTKKCKITGNLTDIEYLYNLQDINEMLDEDPDNVCLLREKAKILIKSKNYAKATTVLNNIVENCPDDLISNTYFAVIAYYNGDYELCRKRIQKIFEKAYDYSDLDEYITYYISEFEETMPEFKNYYENEVYYQKMQNYLDNNNYDLALQYAKKLFEITKSEEYIKLIEEISIRKLEQDDKVVILKNIEQLEKDIKYSIYFKNYDIALDNINKLLSNRSYLVYIDVLYYKKLIEKINYEKEKINMGLGTNVIKKYSNEQMDYKINDNLSKISKNKIKDPKKVRNSPNFHKKSSISNKYISHIQKYIQKYIQKLNI
ncbi:tetratricopeptide repeat protein [Methanococcus voltae]|uniref:TPR repeat-containing protein n=1 Tax=Methanococcus voltae (strain ATCC BAA-1334 / A3) TaxID=456320 RepID=D7DT73_METV3|nr:tetratricopeptide repeat protein [Methanococcus voltae]MCS3901183.1 hypothetical protein [Methanococcus voltae]